MQAAGFSYMCGIGGGLFPAVRSSETSLTCRVIPEKLPRVINCLPICLPFLGICVPSYQCLFVFVFLQISAIIVADISIIQMGPSVTMHPIDTTNGPKGMGL
jgi:hypothetical protein